MKKLLARLIMWAIKDQLDARASAQCTVNVRNLPRAIEDHEMRRG